jgi:hypothetical protein
MEPAPSFTVSRALVACALSVAAFAVACCMSPAIDHAVRTILQIAWRYFVTGARG